MTKVDLTKYSRREDRPDGYRYGRGIAVRTIWHYVNAIVFLGSMFPFSGLKVRLLRLFGAKVGEGVVIKPRVNIKYPWMLELGDHVWLGEDCWLESAGFIRIGSHVAISQGAFLVPGIHDYNDPGFGSYGHPIKVEDGAWIAAFARVTSGVTIGEEAVLLIDAVAIKDLEPRGIYAGNPAKKIGERKIRDYVGPDRNLPEPTAEDWANAGTPV